MKFLAMPWLLMLPLLVVLGAGLWLRAGREIRRRLQAFGSGRRLHDTLAPNAQTSHRKRLLVLLTVMALLAVALARPLGGLRPQAAVRQGVNVLIALDGSSSMLVDDVAPNRFGVAQQGIDRLLATMAGDRAGLLFFGGQATLVAPPHLRHRVAARGEPGAFARMGRQGRFVAGRRDRTRRRLLPRQTSGRARSAGGERRRGDRGRRRRGGAGGICAGWPADFHAWRGHRTRRAGATARTQCPAGMGARRKRARCAGTGSDFEKRPGLVAPGGRGGRRQLS